MIRTTTLLALGLLVAGSTSVLAQQATPSPTPRTSQPHAVTVPLLQPLPIRDIPPPADTVWEPSPTDRSVNDIKSVQLWLREQKLYDRAITGVMNPDTHSALRKFEHAHGLPVTGDISDTVVTLLRSESSLPPCQW